MIDPNDPLNKYRNTYFLYQEVKEYLSKSYKGKPRIDKDTPEPIATVWINKCIKRFTWKKKPPKKVLRLCLYYLDEIGYKFN
jgi:hypothetical protein